MALKPIQLGVARGPVARHRPKAAAGSSVILAEDSAVLERDHHRCQFCGFESKKYQEVVALNGDPGDRRSDNLATACIFCHQCFNIEKVPEMRSGVLIWLPELSQAALSHVCRAIFIARITSGPMADAARQGLDALMGRRDEAKARLGSDDPAIVGAVMQDFLEDRDYAARVKKLKGMRLLPLDRRIVREGEMEFNQFPQILAFWRSKDGPFGGIMPAGWFELFDQTYLAASRAG